MVNATKPRIEANWKISRVLKEYPELLDTLADSHSAFGKLRNPILRRVQSKLVTVEQAAGVAGLETAALLARLNKAAGFEVEPVPIVPKMGARPELQFPDWAEKAKVAEKLDVRPLIARGEEPFSMISGAATRIPVGKALKLRSPFDPVPLRDALAKQGFRAHSAGAGDDWTTIFVREREMGKTDSPAQAAKLMSPVTAEVTIDVSELTPPEPMMKILAALEKLPYGGQLIVQHVRRPIHLYPRLDEMGYAHSTDEVAPNNVRLIITKPAHA